MNVSEHIKEIASQYGWSEYRLVKQSGLSASTISNIYHRDTTPSIHTLTIICDAFGISLSEFFDPNITHAALSEDQQEILKLYYMLNAEQRKALKELMYTIVG